MKVGSILVKEMILKVSYILVIYFEVFVAFLELNGNLNDALCMYLD